MLSFEKEKNISVSYAYALVLFWGHPPPLDKISSGQRKKRKLSASLSNRNTIRSSRCEGRIERTSSAFTRRRSCGYEFGVVEFAVKTMRRVLLRARARARDDCKKKIIAL
jgi:hypothetical protein